MPCEGMWISGGIPTHIQNVGVRWGRVGNPGQGALATNWNMGGRGLMGVLYALEQSELAGVLDLCQNATE
jgi:hypothetical protein